MVPPNLGSLSREAMLVEVFPSGNVKFQMAEVQSNLHLKNCVATSTQGMVIVALLPTASSSMPSRRIKEVLALVKRWVFPGKTLHL
jgi:hypothetical protein